VSFRSVPYVPSDEEELMARPRAVVPGLVLCGVLVAGCGGGDGGGEAAASTTATTAAATTTTEGPSTGGEPTTTTAGFSGTVIEAKVTGSRVETAERRVRVDRGERVRIRVEADRNEEVHLHGYDLSEDVAPGRPAVLDFTADAPGVFEVELEQAHLKLFEIQVQ
jgi:FtsP/CotA-like multicopper oxidase with cupredoxin domain